MATARNTVSFEAPTEREGEWWHAEVTPATGSPFAYATVKVNGMTLSGNSWDIPLRLPAYPSYTVPGYDADGNLLADNRTFYTWDGENRLTETWSPAPHQGPGVSYLHLTYRYDASGRRIAKNVFQFDEVPNSGGSWLDQETPLYQEHYLYDGWNLTTTFRAQSSGFSFHRGYIWGPDVSGTLRGAGGVGGLLMIIDTSQIHFPAYDGNGNVLALLRAAPGTAATVDAAYEYDPFGRTLRANGVAAEGNPFRFSTKFTDEETGLVYYGFRYYSPVEGRWLGRDPVGEKGGFNLYGMCGNSVLSSIDSLGLYVPDGRYAVALPPVIVAAQKIPGAIKLGAAAAAALYAFGESSASDGLAKGIADIFESDPLPPDPKPEPRVGPKDPPVPPRPPLTDDECEKLRRDVDKEKIDGPLQKQLNILQGLRPDRNKRLPSNICDDLRDMLEKAERELALRRPHFSNNCDRVGDANKSYDQRRRMHEGRIKELLDLIKEIRAKLRFCGKS